MTYGHGEHGTGKSEDVAESEFLLAGYIISSTLMPVVPEMDHVPPKKRGVQRRLRASWA